MKKNTDTHHEPKLPITREQREATQGHRGLVLWMTGLSGAGKSTLAHEIDRRCFENNMRSFILDGDLIRAGLCQDLGFSLEDRSENLRRAAETAKLLCHQGLVTIVSFISPTQADRDQARAIIGPDFIECYIQASLSVCEGRDPKGLYKKARAGQIQDFTGVSSPFEVPRRADLTVVTEARPPDVCAEELWVAVRSRCRQTNFR